MACPAAHCPVGGLHAVHHRGVAKAEAVEGGKGLPRSRVPALALSGLTLVYARCTYEHACKSGHTRPPGRPPGVAGPLGDQSCSMKPFTQSFRNQRTRRDGAVAVAHCALRLAPSRGPALPMGKATCTLSLTVIPLSERSERGVEMKISTPSTVAAHHPMHQSPHRTEDVLHCSAHNTALTSTQPTTPALACPGYGSGGGKFSG